MAQLDRDPGLKRQDLDRVYVRNPGGDLIQLSSVVKHQVGAAPNAIEHYNRMRSATISGTPVSMPLGTVLNRVEEMLRADLPAGFLYAWSGESRDLRDTGQEVWLVLILALIIVYMVLAAQFESLVHPLTAILAVPLAAAGPVGLLLLANFRGQARGAPALPRAEFN